MEVCACVCLCVSVCVKYNKCTKCWVMCYPLWFLSVQQSRTLSSLHRSVRLLGLRASTSSYSHCSVKGIINTSSLHTAYYLNQITPEHFHNFPSVKTELTYFFSFCTCPCAYPSAAWFSVREMHQRIKEDTLRAGLWLYCSPDLITYSVISIFIL